MTDIRAAIEDLRMSAAPDLLPKTFGWHYAPWQGVTWGAAGDTHCTVSEDDSVTVWVDWEAAASGVVPGAYESALGARPEAVQALVAGLGLDDSPVDALGARYIYTDHCSWSGRIALMDGQKYYLPLSSVVRQWRRIGRDRAPWAALPGDGDPYGEAADLFRVSTDQVETRWEDGHWWGRLRHEHSVWLEAPALRVEGPRRPSCWPMDTPQEAGEVSTFWHQGHLILLEPNMARVRLTPADREGRLVVTGIVGGGTWPWREYGEVACAVIEAAVRQGLL